jgi:hypothetical protein
MIVYIVTSGSYSEYRIEDAFLDQGAANSLARHLYEGNVGAWQINEAPAFLLTGKTFFDVQINGEEAKAFASDPRGKVEQSGWIDDWDTDKRDMIKIYQVLIWAKDRDEAIARAWEIHSNESQTVGGGI